MSKKRKIIISIISGIVIGLLIAGGLTALKISVLGKFPHGTKIAGIDISYKTLEQAKEILNQEKERYLNTPIQIILNSKPQSLSQSFMPKELGIDILADGTISSLKESKILNMSLLDWLNSSSGRQTDINIFIKINYEKLIKEISEKFELEALKPQSAMFYFENRKKLAIKEGKEGLALNEKKLFEDVKNSAKQLTSAPITLELNKTSPKITKEILQSQEEKIKKQLNYKFTLIDPIYSDDWTISLAEHLDWVRFAEKKEDKLPEFADIFLPNKIARIPPQIQIEIDPLKLSEFIDKEISKWLDRPAKDVHIYKNKEEKIIIEGEGSGGLKIQRQHLKKAIELAVANEIKEVKIPVIEIPPQINISADLQELGIKERIGIGHTSYYGSPANRVYNIKVGAARFNGHLIAPDEIFSFNKTLGPVDASTGYKKELVIKPEGTIPDFGGGICQLSTTVYRAALFSGLQITERNQHTYAVRYYSQILGHGLDATVYLGGPNLKFKNDTGKYILVQAYTKDDYELYIVFFGTSDGRIVNMEGPYISDHKQPGPTVYEETLELPAGEKKQVEKSHVGFNALWYRYITYPDGKTVKEPIATKYKAIPEKILVGVEKLTESVEPITN